MSDQGLKDLEASVAAHANLESLEAENARLHKLLNDARLAIGGYLSPQRCEALANEIDTFRFTTMRDKLRERKAQLDAALGEKTA